MKPLRIVQVMHSHGWGGAERHIVSLTRALAEAGHELAFAGPRDSWLNEQMRAMGVPTHHLRMTGLADPLSHWSLGRFARTWRADVLHGHGVRASFYVGWAAGRRRGCVSISTAHSTLARKHMGRCDHVIAVSDAVRAQLLAHGARADGVTTVYNGVPEADVTDRSAKRLALGLDDAHFALFNAGRFVHDKGQDLLIEAVRRCRWPVVLHLAGDLDTRFGAEMGAAVQGDARIRCLGYRDDVSRILVAYDAYACTSRREAFGLSLAEACSAALPVVAMAVGGIPEIVVDGLNGRLVAPGDVAALAQALDALAADRALAAEWGAQGRRRYEAHFSIDRMTRGTLDVYARALAA